MTCKDCIQYKNCKEIDRKLDLNFSIKEAEEMLCEYFKDKSKFVELPCKVGDTVYFLSGKEAVVTSFYFCKNIECGNLWVTLKSTNKRLSFSCAEINKTVFLTREEAEAKLKDLNNSKE